MDNSNKLLLGGLPHRLVAFLAGAALLLGVSFAAILPVGEESPSFDTGDPTADYILSCLYRDDLGVSTMSLGPSTSSYEGKYSAKIFRKSTSAGNWSSTIFSMLEGTNIYPTTDTNIYGVVTEAKSTNQPVQVAFNTFDAPGVFCDFYVTDLGLINSSYSLSGSFTSSFSLRKVGSTTTTGAIAPSSCYLLVNGEVVGDPMTISGTTVTVGNVNLADYPKIDSIGFRLAYSGKDGFAVAGGESYQGIYSFNLSKLNYNIVEPPPVYPLPDDQYNGFLKAMDAIKQANADGFTFVQGEIKRQTTSINASAQNDRKLIVQAIENLGTIQSPMDKFESEYLEKFQGQIDKTESALSPSNPALPNNGDVGGFTEDIQKTMGINGSSFDPQQFADAVSSFSGSASTDDGGMWQFFTQAVADALATPGGTTRSFPQSPQDELDEYISEAERWLSKW